MEREKLTNCETLVMKCVWTVDGDISMKELSQKLKDDFNKEYKRTTICTFLLHMEQKGYVTTHRNGLYSYVHPLVTEEEFRKEQIKDTLSFWFDNSLPKLFAAACDGRKVDKEEAQKIQEIIDNMKK